MEAKLEMELEVPVVEADPGRRGVPCPNCDIQVVHKLAQLLLPGLATACVDSTFRNPSSVAVQLRKEMVDCVTNTSQIHPSLFPVELEDPTETVAVFLDDFASTESSILSSVSGWLPYMSDSRDDRIDDLVQEMETTRFWPLDRREAVARVLLRNLDTRFHFHCREELETQEMLAEHAAEHCSFRPVRCRNQGCRTEVSARRAEEHDSVCLFKILPCEQHCELSVTRRQMDRHCITACPMKLTNCPFYQLGCESAFPTRNLQSHCAQFLRPHLRKLLLNRNKITNHHEDITEERLLLLEKCDSYGTLVKALDVRSLTNALGELEKKMNADDDSSGDKNAAQPHKEAMHAHDSDSTTPLS